MVGLDTRSRKRRHLSPAALGVAMEIDASSNGKFNRDLRMIRMAVKKGWNIPERILESLAEKVAGIAETTLDDRTCLNATKVLVMMDRANIARDLAAKEPANNQVNVNVGVAIDHRPITTVEQRNAEIASICNAVLERERAIASQETPGTPDNSVLPTLTNGETGGIPEP